MSSDETAWNDHTRRAYDTDSSLSRSSAADAAVQLVLEKLHSESNLLQWQVTFCKVTRYSYSYILKVTRYFFVTFDIAI